MFQDFNVYTAQNPPLSKKLIIDMLTQWNCVFLTPQWAYEYHDMSTICFHLCLSNYTDLTLQRSSTQCAGTIYSIQSTG
jgi:hypothetical protein